MASYVVEYLNVGNVFLLILLAFFIYQLVELYQFRGMPPGPRLTNLPFIGSLLSFDLKADNFQDAVASLRRKYGHVMSLKLGSFKFVIAGTSEAVREMLVMKSADYSGRPETHTLNTMTLGGKDLIFGNGSSWKHYRRIFMTALRKYLSNTPLIEARITHATEKMLKEFQEHDGNGFDPVEAVMYCVGDVITGVTFGKDCNTSDPDIEKMLHFNEFGFKSYQDLQALLFLEFFPVAKYFPFKSCQNIVNIYHSALEVVRKKLRDCEKVFDPEEPPSDLMRALLQARREAQAGSSDEKLTLMSEDYFVNVVEDMFAAGYETTTTSLSWAIGFLVAYPKYQRAIQQQLDEVVGRDRMPSLEDRPHLPLIHATIMETLRLGNVLPQALPHSVLKDTSLCGYRVPKGATVFADTQAVHLDPKCWENPTVFDPYRHIDEDGNVVTNQGNFYPFGAGRRVCAGEALAKVELFLFLSRMLHNFTFLPEEGHDPPQLKPLRGITRYPAPYKIRAIKRD